MSDYLIHHGIKGQKWGVRRFQNPDGTRTAAGKSKDASERYREREVKRAEREYNKAMGDVKRSFEAADANVKRLEAKTHYQYTRDFYRSKRPTDELARAYAQRRFKAENYNLLAALKFLETKRLSEMTPEELAVDKQAIAKKTRRQSSADVRLSPEQIYKAEMDAAVAADLQPNYTSGWSPNYERQMPEFEMPLKGPEFKHGETLTMYPDQHTYLIHWLKKGEKAKYVDKIKLANGRWRYFYSQAELEAYKKGLSKSASSLADKAKQGLHNLKEGALDTGARALVRVARKNNAVASRLGAHDKRTANVYNNRANSQRAEASRLQNLSDRERAKSASAFRRDQYDRSNDARHRANGLQRQAKEQSASASYWQRLAAESQKKYDSSVLGKAEARVRAADIRKANKKRRKR